MQVDPVRDLQIITDELLAKDRQTMTTQIEMLKKIVARGQDKQAKMDLVCVRGQHIGSHAC